MQKNQRIIRVTLLLLFINSSYAAAQDIHYSQFFNSPLLLNPAYTGQIDGKWRFNSTYKSQGYQMQSDAINSFSCSFDMPINIKETQIGLGVTYNNDFSYITALSNNQLHFSLASAIKISDKSGLGLGLQVGYTNKHINYNKLSFPSQYDRDNGYHNVDLSNNESFINGSIHNVNVNAGIVWNYNTLKYEISTGLSAIGINNANYSFLGVENIGKTRFNWHTSLNYKINNQISFTPQALVSYQNNASIVTLGTNASTILVSNEYKKTGLTIGVYERTNLDFNINTIILVGGFMYNNWLTYVSYDIDISSKSQNIFSNAIEITVAYELPDLKLNKTTVPWIRY